MDDPITNDCTIVEILSITDSFIYSMAIESDLIGQIRFYGKDLNGLPINVGDTISIQIVKYEKDLVQLAFPASSITCQKVRICK
jgi:hypothetical protein